LRRWGRYFVALWVVVCLVRVGVDYPPSAGQNKSELTLVMEMRRQADLAATHSPQLNERPVRWPPIRPKSIGLGVCRHQAIVADPKKSLPGLR
jgi:hypothetical protein